MKRHLNLPIWLGFLIVVASLVSYIPIFAVFASTRDVPWVNYMLFAVGAALLAIGIRRAFRDPERYRGKITGSILGVLSALLIGLFLVGVLYFTRQMPAGQPALKTGQPAPAFTLPDTAGKMVSSADLLKTHRALLLVFYRGYW